MRRFPGVLGVGVVLLLGACSDSSDDFSAGSGQGFLPIPQATVSLPPDTGAPFDYRQFDLGKEGYGEFEYFISGTASSYSNTSELTSDGFWEVEAAGTVDYTTRVLVRRPLDPADFNGTVLVEWLNVTSGFDSTPEWDNAHVEIIRRGYAWIGLSAQSVGVNGSENSFVPFDLKSFDPVRYEALVHPGDSFSFDMFTQLARAIRDPGEIDLLDGMVAERLIAAGNSQSAFTLTTYVNAIHPMYNPYDGYILHSRGEYSFPLSVEPQTLIQTPSQVLIRTDLNVPVLTIQSETDVLYQGLNSVTVRQDDSDLFRLWEVAGTSHSDEYSTARGWQDTGADPAFAAVVEQNTIQGVIKCDLPTNSGHIHYVYNAALDAMNRWIVDGTPAPSGDPLQVSDDLLSFELDEAGNALGGVRTPYVDAPAAVLSGLGATGLSFCQLFGTTDLFDASEMASRYVDQAGYVAAVSAAAQAAVESGFLLQADADLIVAWAPEQWNFQVAP